MTSESKIRVLLIDSAGQEREKLKALLENWGFEVTTADTGRIGYDLVKKIQPTIILSDLIVPEMDGLSVFEALKKDGVLDPIAFIFLSAHGNIDTAVEAIKKGAYDFLTKPLDIIRLKVLLETIAKRSSAAREMYALRDKVRKLGTFGKLNGSTAKMKAIFKLVEVMAPTTASILITGESGTGKDLLAKTIHQSSKRKDEPFISFNCKTIPEDLLEKELFGQGNEPGSFELADHGTIFMDEIGSLAVELQGKLLHVLETGTIRKLGGKNESQVDVRVIAANHRSLEEAVEEDGFREDLLSQLNVFHVRIPALRERAEDIPLLGQNFIEEFNLKNDRNTKGISREALNLLKAYSWPGNVRELKNVIERSVIVCKEDYIGVADLPENLTSKAHKVPTVQFRLGQTMEDVEKDFLFNTLNYVDGNKTKAAKMLDISLKTLHNKLAKYKSSI
jgi:two-component system, NtrC family, response regulator HydG